jgi:hypothetical protein
MIFAAALLMASSPVDPVRWRCTHNDLGGEDSLNVERTLDVAGRALSDFVYWSPNWRSTDSSVRWIRRGAITSTALPWQLQTDWIQAELTLSRAARRPVWVVLRVGDRLAGRRLLFRRMSDLQTYERNHLKVHGMFRTSGPTRGPVPDLTNATEIVMTAEEEGGATLARSVIRLPSQDIVQAMVAQVAPMLVTDAADYRTRCRDVTLPIPVPPPMPPRR